MIELKTFLPFGVDILIIALSFVGFIAGYLTKDWIDSNIKFIRKLINR